MSLILEALRKSEAERRRGLAPDVAVELPPVPTARPRTLTAWLLPALVIAALLALAGWWANREPASLARPNAVVEATDTPLTQHAPVPALTPRIEPTPAAPAVVSVPAPEIPAPVVAMQVPTAPASPPVPASTPSASAPEARPAPIQPPPARPLPPQPTSDISNDTSMLPPIKLSMHMWDDVPSRRFVILNGQRMAEGDRYGGITVIAIERAGVVVESNGAKARVPLP